MATLHPLKEEPFADENMKRRIIECPELKRPTMQERLDMQSRAAGEAAIKRYNRKKGVNYEFDMPLNSNGFSCYGKDYIHVNFTAKNLEDVSAPSKLFFAEVGYLRIWKAESFSECAIEDPTETDPMKVSKGCTFCSSAFTTPILHAVGHFTLGKYEKFCYVHLECEEEDEGGWG